VLGVLRGAKQCRTKVAQGKLQAALVLYEDGQLPAAAVLVRDETRTGLPASPFSYPDLSTIARTCFARDVVFPVPGGPMIA
jgi:hypothetical protein